MAKIIPFKGTYYNKAIFDDVSSLLAPPYDVVTPAERDKIVGENPNNIFSLELPVKSQCLGDVKDKYDCAAKILKTWLTDNVLVTAKQPSIYLYEIEFTLNGIRFLRKGFICLIRTDDWSEGTILPHERTFEKVTKERFKLRVATKAQFSQIFMLYRHHQVISNILSAVMRNQIFEVMDRHGCCHRLYRLTDERKVQELCAAFNDRALYIADGHHRYTTAIRYRREMVARYGDNPDASYNYTMVYLVDAEDPGMIVLPTHRLMSIPKGMDCLEVKRRLSEYFELKEADFPCAGDCQKQARALRDSLSDSCSQGIIILFGHKKKAFILCPTEQARRELLENVGHKALAMLDVVVLEELVFKKALGLDMDRLESERAITYTADSEDAVKRLQDHQMLFFMHPTPVQQVLDVADAGLTMPHKSTYFYPKILTGLVINVEE